MSSSGINFKVYSVIGDNSEVKRFFVDTDAVTSFVFMKEKLKSVFPNLREGDFKITWKDTDGDHISISNDEDFITALTEMNYNPKVLYVNAETRNVSEQGNGNPRMYWVVCDVCQKAIIGYRYKCIECADYDLCSTCESSGHHSEHMVLRLPNSNTPIAKVDRKMMYNAARALKKSAFNVAKHAHRCARDSFKGGEKEKHQEDTEMPSAEHNPAYECPFSTAEMSELFTQNISPLIEMLSKGASNATKEAAPPNPISDIVRSVTEAFTGFVNPEAGAKSSTSETANTIPPQATPKPSSPNTTDKTPTPAQKSKPSAPSAENATNVNNQEMEWTIVNDSEESSQGSQTPTTQPPPPPQDTRLMRGLAQLYEMGFSNENQFLNYMLETHNYNVGDVVKAILEIK